MHHIILFLEGNCTNLVQKQVDILSILSSEPPTSPEPPLSGDEDDENTESLFARNDRTLRRRDTSPGTSRASENTLENPMGDGTPQIMMRQLSQPYNSGAVEEPRPAPENLLDSPTTDMTRQRSLPCRRSADRGTC